MLTSRQWNTDVTVGTFPPNLAGTVIGSSAFSIDATNSVVVADWLQARVQFSFLILIAWFLPARLADDISLVVTDIPVGVKNNNF